MLRCVACSSKQVIKSSSPWIRKRARLWGAISVRETSRVLGGLWDSLPACYLDAECHPDLLWAYQTVVFGGRHHCQAKGTQHIERFNGTLRQRTGPEGAVLSKTRTGPGAAKPVRCCFKAKTGAVLSKTAGRPTCSQDPVVLEEAGEPYCRHLALCPSLQQIITSLALPNGASA